MIDFNIVLCGQEKLELAQGIENFDEKDREAAERKTKDQEKKAEAAKRAKKMQKKTKLSDLLMAHVIVFVGFSWVCDEPHLRVPNSLR